MALTPLDEAHALQIQAGTIGRTTGHTFETQITQEINAHAMPMTVRPQAVGHVHRGSPSEILLNYICSREHIGVLSSVVAISTGALATSEEGKRWLSINGVAVARCKSDLVITLTDNHGRTLTVGVSTKQCNNKTPTNAQLYFTTARGFSKLLTDNGLTVSNAAVEALRQFCGDPNFRPLDSPTAMVGRRTDPRRYFWEEISSVGRVEWERTLSAHQNDITRLLLQKAYIDDPFTPDYLLHKTKKADSWTTTEVAVYKMDELIALSRAYQGFELRPYSVRKGSYKDPAGVSHSAPRFGIVQMQRGGQAQHPDQLQFNLEASYFYKI
jgi:hypothetical protein